LNRNRLELINFVFLRKDLSERIIEFKPRSRFGDARGSLPLNRSLMMRRFFAYPLKSSEFNSAARRQRVDPLSKTIPSTRRHLSTLLPQRFAAPECHRVDPRARVSALRHGDRRGVPQDPGDRASLKTSIPKPLTRYRPAIAMSRRTLDSS
jgi:hypothetical protein